MDLDINNSNVLHLHRLALPVTQQPWGGIRFWIVVCSRQARSREVGLIAPVESLSSIRVERDPLQGSLSLSRIGKDRPLFVGFYIPMKIKSEQKLM